MGQIKKYPSPKLIVGFIFKQEDVFDQAKKIMQKRFGKIDFESRQLVFNHTDYYRNELGENLQRKFISFQKLILPKSLVEIKILTNKIENKLSLKGTRQINIDPGYLDLAKLVLASTKDFCHRIYLDRGIFAEITLFYKHKSFQTWEWTYPDYRSQEYITIFNRIREIYACQIKDI
jgi:hypothetical protein